MLQCWDVLHLVLLLLSQNVIDLLENMCSQPSLEVVRTIVVNIFLSKPSASAGVASLLHDNGAMNLIL